MNFLAGSIDSGGAQVHGQHILSQIVLGQMLENETTRMLTLLFGLAAFAGGIVMMFSHQQSHRTAMSEATDDRERLFEGRKNRRRMTASSMLSAMGVMLGSLYWATEPMVSAILISLVLVSLLGVLGLAVLDILSVGLRQIAKPNDTARKAVVEEYLKRRKQQQKDEQANIPAEPESSDLENSESESSEN